LAQAEEEILEQDPIIQSEINEARKAYKAKDYISIDEYIENRSGYINSSNKINV